MIGVENEDLPGLTISAPIGMPFDASERKSGDPSEHARPVEGPLPSPDARLGGPTTPGCSGSGLGHRQVSS